MQGICRTRHAQAPQPVKLWYLSSFFRYERAQKGRQRQFWQVGAEAFGSEDPALDAESILLLGTLLEELGVRDVRLRLSSLGSSDSRQRYRERLRDICEQTKQTCLRRCASVSS